MRNFHFKRYAPLLCLEPDTLRRGKLPTVAAPSSLGSQNTSRFVCILKIYQRGLSLPRSRCIIHTTGTNRRRQQHLLLDSQTLLAYAGKVAHPLYFYAKSRFEHQMSSICDGFSILPFGVDVA